MKTNLEKLNEKIDLVYSSLNKRLIEAKQKANDVKFAENDFFHIANLEYADLQKDFNGWELLNKINDDKKRDKNYNESVELDKQSENEILKLGEIKGYSKYFDERSVLQVNHRSDNQKSLIVWNEKKGQKLVYANFLKLAYGIVYSEKYFLVEDHKKKEAIEQLAQFFGVKMGKGWNTTPHNVKEKIGDPDIFIQLRTSYINNKKPKQKTKKDKS